MTFRPLLIALLTTVSASAVSVATWADPSARVGRVAYSEGGVSLQPPQSDTWTWAGRNYPVAPGEAFWTGDDGRVQLQIGAADVRVDSQTELDILDLDYGEMRLALTQGSVDVRLWSTPRGGVTLATPAGDVHLDGQGLYRVDVGAPANDGAYPTVELTVFEGSAGAPSPDGPAVVHPGQSAVIYAGYEPQMQDAQDAAIDAWGYDREVQTPWRPENDDAAAMTGLGDLYAAGEFATEPQYGRVWYPRDVPADWAPYRDGHWSYVEPWGYTWIDDQPWGFAPFHYGRWAQIDDRWAWIPGRQTPEPVYAPALVAFLGGGGWNVGGRAAIGWAPLAPEESYRPGYSVSESYRRRVNVGSVRMEVFDHDQGETRPFQAYRNARAATIVPSAAFSNAQPVRRQAIPVTIETIAQAPRSIPTSQPPPTPEARGGGRRPDAAGRSGFSPLAPMRPPAGLQAVRQAVVAPSNPSGRPPAIVGARFAAPPPRPNAGSGGAAPLLVAPAQSRQPRIQGPQIGAGPSSGPGRPGRPAVAGATSAIAPALPSAAVPARPTAHAPAGLGVDAARRADRLNSPGASPPPAATQPAAGPSRTPGPFSTPPTLARGRPVSPDQKPDGPSRAPNPRPPALAPDNSPPVRAMEDRQPAPAPRAFPQPDVRQSPRVSPPRAAAEPTGARVPPATPQVETGRPTASAPRAPAPVRTRPPADRKHPESGTETPQP